MKSLQTVRILVVKPSAFGDVVQMLQVMEGAYHAAEAIGKHLEIHWIIKKDFAEFLRLSPVVSRLFLFDRKGGVSGFIRLMREVRAYSYDFLIDGQGLLRTGLMTFFAKSTKKIGRGNAREGSRYFYHQTFLPTKVPFHEVDILQSLLTPLHLSSVPQRPLTLQLPSWHFPFEPGAILLFPNSHRPKKEWPFFYELTNLLLEKTSHHCVWVGQSSPAKVPQHPRFVNWIGKTTISDVPLLIRSACCVIANDSAPVHLAAAFQKPLVGIYGPTDGQRSGPYPTNEHCILQAPCGNLQKVLPEVVIKSVLQQLQK